MRIHMHTLSTDVFVCPWGCSQSIKILGGFFWATKRASFAPSHCDAKIFFHPSRHPKSFVEGPEVSKCFSFFSGLGFQDVGNKAKHHSLHHVNCRNSYFFLSTKVSIYRMIGMPVCWHTFERTWNHVCILTVIAYKYLLQRCKDGGTRSPQLIVVAGHVWSHQSNMFQQVFGTQQRRDGWTLITCHLPDNYHSVSYTATMDFEQPKKKR